ncbi:MAG: exosortase system-associated protein, TIGR04073 family [Candidatus Omnitrophota bacterium]
MKKYFLVLGVALFVLMGLVSGASAEDSAFTKFGRGMANIVISPGELYTQPLLLSKTSEPSIAAFGGLFKGLSMFIAREVVGIYEVVTFPIPNFKGYGPIIEPATTFTDWDTRKPPTQKVTAE